MTSLFGSYGNLTAKELLKKQQILTNYVYNPHLPIDKLFAVAQDYQDYATFHGTPQPPTTIITTVYEVLRKTTKFKQALENWSDRPPHEKTWNNFKAAMRRASISLREHTPDTSSQAGFSNQVVDDITQGVANMLQHTDEDNEQTQAFLQNLSNAVQHNQQAFDTMTENFNTLQQEVQSMNAVRGGAPNPNGNRGVRFGNKNQYRNPPPPFVPPPDITQAYHQVPLMSQNGNPQMPSMPYHIPPPPFHQPSFQPSHQQLSNLFRQLNPTQQRTTRRTNNRNNNRQWQNHGNWNNNNTNWNNNTNNYNRGYRNSGRGSGARGRGTPRTNHYCWTHGACGHPSDQCNNPANGHQYNATFRNQMGGNTDGSFN